MFNKHTNNYNSSNYFNNFMQEKDCNEFPKYQYNSNKVNNYNTDNYNMKDLHNSHFYNPTATFHQNFIPGNSINNPYCGVSINNNYSNNNIYNNNINFVVINPESQKGENSFPNLHSFKEFKPKYLQQQQSLPIQNTMLTSNGLQSTITANSSSDMVVKSSSTNSNSSELRFNSIPQELQR